mmetsp:Transcript_118268/g.230018  ORF Transcript_118268/g.230018 Transcript_118268/m.230018 type:complete len:96 (-) Transcript_118268:27-314(-)
MTARQSCLTTRLHGLFRRRSGVATQLAVVVKLTHGALPPMIATPTAKTSRRVSGEIPRQCGVVRTRVGAAVQDKERVQRLLELATTEVRAMYQRR